jgi:FKBP-type peptidyl-prolyl cis-trans isomerase 2
MTKIMIISMERSYYITIVVLLLVLSVLGCTNTVVAKNGDNVSVLYTVHDSEGNFIDSMTNASDPLTFVIGDGQTIAGFNYAVIGLAVGENKTVTLPPFEAYGEHDLNLTRWETSDTLIQANITPKIGNTLYVVLGTDKQKGVITSFNGTHYLIDFNHVLAGKTLIFDITLLKINSKTGDIFG